jgi:hypothetical protein
MSPVSLKQNITKPEKKAETIEDMIERAYEAHPNNTKDAARALEEMILVNEDVFFEVMKPHLARICHTMLIDGMSHIRRAVWNPGAGGLTKTARAITAAGHDAVVALASSNLMLFPLRNGTRLGDASRVEVGETADYYARTSADAGHKSRWLTLIAQSLGDGETVSDKFTETRLAELKQEAEHAA